MYKLYTKYFTENQCMKTTGNRVDTLGIIVHSTACGFVPAKDWYARWNKPTVAKATHAFVDDKEVWQYLPWEHVCWGAGKEGGNYHYINFECCEPAGVYESNYNAKAHQAYFDKMYANARDLCVTLCKQFGLTADNIVAHYEGYKLGIASNHGDVKEFFGKHGKTMDDLRNDVRDILNGKEISPVAKKSEPIVTSVMDFEIGDIVNFTGGYHYSNSNKETASGSARKSGEAKVINTAKLAKHPYCLKYTSGSKSNVYGWVDVADIEPLEVVHVFEKGDVVKIKEGCTTYYNGAKMPSWVRKSTLYVRDVRDDGSVVVSTLKSGAVTGTVDAQDLIWSF